MILRRLKTALLLGLLTATLSGCLYSRELSQIRRDVERQVPEAEIRKEFVLSLGPISMRMARWFAPLVTDTGEFDAYLHEIKRVKVGVYRVDGGSSSGREVEMPRRLQRMVRNDWQVAVRVRDRQEAVWVLYRDTGSSVRDVFVMVLDGNELVMVRLNGRLDRILAHAIEQHGDLLGRHH